MELVVHDRTLIPACVEALSSTPSASPLWMRAQGGLPSRHARLVWEGAVGIESLYPVRAIAVADLPDAYGAAASSCSSRWT
jgi:hypothetical protein